MKNFNFTFSPSEDETKGLMPRRACPPRLASTRGGLRNGGSGLARGLITFI